MEKSRKKLRVCLICVVLLAVVVGMFYYYYETQGQKQANEGTLITKSITGMRLWR